MTRQGERGVHEGHRPQIRHRVFLVAVFGAVTLMYAYLLFQLVRIQILDADTYAAMARRYHLFAREEPAPRGRILDRRGRVLAESVPVKSVWARPAAISDPARVAELLAPVLGRPARDLERELARPASSVRLCASLESEAAIARLDRARAALAREGIQGVDVHDRFRRFYPYRHELSHLVGCVGAEGHGLLGVERKYDSVLRGESGYALLERDARTRPFHSARSGRREPVPGGDVVLTVDMAIQHFLERQLDWAHETFGAASAVGVVLEPGSGEILALANRPTFDPNRLSDAAPSDLSNRALTDTFAPGSTFKPFVVASALQQGILRPADRFDCGDGSFSFDGRIVHDVHPSRMLDVAGVLVRSSNVGVAKIGLRLGGERLRAYVHGFGFGRRTGLALGGESAGLVTDPADWTEKYTTVSVSFGQEIAVTPLQLALGFSSLVNGGRWHAPVLVSRLTRRDGVVQELPREIPRQVISARISRTVREMLVRVCDEGSGVAARVPGYGVGGKTGTSEKFRGKQKHGYVSTFAAFAPASDPRLCVLILVNEPQGARYGRVVAAPAAGRVLADTLAYLEVPPTRPDGGTPRSADVFGPDPASTHQGWDRSP